ncbi:sulfurtransferase TusA family protein [Thiotrichales bacterium 19S3-7]|nr:sulfurtransferase TusA family protein [Thiotrichales bacterium 19S3-7]MCF6802510.1 sulfurtransferase TusA family protein [Thiotrichales bacterium 19S3-11]
MACITELDARRLLCPMPVIKTQNHIKKMTKGEQLKVICTDPGSLEDIPAWCRVHGHKVLDTQQCQFEIIFIIEVGE